MTRLTELERRYPAVPTSVLLKTDLIFTGLRVSRALVEAGPGSMPHFLRVAFDGEPRTIPYFLHVPDGTPAGQELLVIVRPNPASPYHMEAGTDGGYRLCEDARVVCAVRPQPRPAWYTWAEQRGLRRATTGMNQHGDMLVANLTPACDYWAAPGEAGDFRCLFCGYGAVSERSASLGQQRGAAAVSAATLAEFQEVLPHSREETRHLYLVGGSMRDREAEGRRYLALTQAAVAAEPAYRGRIGCGSQALPRDWSRAVRDAGAAYACFNLEVWDADLWSRLCPGKARFIGRERWLQDMLDAVAVFGRGAVLTAFVAGAELVPPLGLATPEQAVASNAEGADWLLARGIVPIHSPLSPALTSAYGRAAAPDLDYFVRLNLETRRLRRRHALALDPRFVCGGCLYAQIEADLDRLT